MTFEYFSTSVENPLGKQNRWPETDIDLFFLRPCTGVLEQIGFKAGLKLMAFDAGRPAALGFNTLTFLKVVRFEGTMEERPWRKWLFERARNNNTRSQRRIS